MQWIRKNRSVGSLAALFALSIQLVLSFGHIHPEDIRGTSPSGNCFVTVAKHGR